MPNGGHSRLAQFEDCPVIVCDSVSKIIDNNDYFDGCLSVPDKLLAPTATRPSKEQVCGSLATCLSP